MKLFTLCLFLSNVNLFSQRLPDASLAIYQAAGVTDLHR